MAMWALGIAGTVVGSIVVSLLKKIVSEMVTIRDDLKILAVRHEMNTKTIDDHESRIRSLELRDAG